MIVILDKTTIDGTSHNKLQALWSKFANILPSIVYYFVTHLCNLSVQNICYVILFWANGEINYSCLKTKPIFQTFC